MSQGATTGSAQPKSHRSPRRGVLRTKLGLATAPPWLRAPLLLVRYPGLLLAIGSALVILSVAGASSPLFISSAGNATLQDGIAATCPWDVALTHQTNAPIAGQALLSYYGQPESTALTKIRDAAAFMSRVDSEVHHLGPPQLQIVGITIQVSGALASSEPRLVRLYARPEAFSNVQRVASTGGPGVWLPESAATALRVGPGDSVRLTNQLGVGPRSAKVRVAAIYRDLVTLPRARFWCGQDHLIYPLNVFDNRPPPPPFLIADEATVLSLEQKLGERDAEFTWVFPVRPNGLTVPEGQTLVATMQVMSRRIGQRPKGAYFIGGSPSPLGGVGRTNSDLSFIVDQAAATQSSLRGPVQAISLAARAVALLVVAAAGIYWIDRRRTEAYLLSAKGVGGLGLGTKVLLEAIPVGAAAAFAGWWAGVWLAKLLGPTDLLDAGAPAAALRQVLWTAALGVVVLAIVAGYGAHRAAESEPIRGRRALAAAPWELIVLGLSAASLYEILTRGTRPVESGGPPKIDVLIVLFPILFVAGGAGLAVRGLRRLLPRLRAAGRDWASPVYFASRRLAAAPRIALALVTAAALAIGILSYAGALRASVAATSEAKALLFTGSNVSVTVSENIEVPRPLSANSTAVTEIDSAYTLPDQTLVKVLGVDRGTFARAAFWDASFASASLPKILEELQPGPASAPLPVLVAGGALPRATGETIFFRGGNVEIPIRVIGTAIAFPGMGPDRPMVVADRQALAERKAPGLRSIWTKSPVSSAEQAVRSAGAHILAVATAREVQSNPVFLPLRWAFGFLQALGIMSGLIVLGGILLYLEARQRGRAISYALASRMGLSRRSNRSSVALELGALLALGCVVGIALAWIAARIVYRRLDPLPQLPPAPLFRLPLAVFGVTTVAVLAAAWLGAWRVQRQAECVSVGEVMRVAG